MFTGPHSRPHPWGWEYNIDRGGAKIITTVRVNKRENYRQIAHDVGHIDSACVEGWFPTEQQKRSTSDEGYLLISRLHP